MRGSTPKLFAAATRSSTPSACPTPGHAPIVVADPLMESSYTEAIRGCDTFIHLVGVPHPSPAKAAQFRAIDLPSVQVAVKAAPAAGIHHFIYLSVAQPAPMMHEFI